MRRWNIDLRSATESDRAFLYQLHGSTKRDYITDLDDWCTRRGLWRTIEMPKHTQHALITWIQDSADGQREARRLHARFRDYSVIKEPTKLVKAELGDYMSVIVVGHREEFDAKRETIVQLLEGSDCHWLVLANCHSGMLRNFGTLGNNELWAPAQYLANKLNIKVSGTSRELTFDEVGLGLAFALTLGEVLIRSNPTSSPSLWRDYEKQGAVAEITEAFGHL